jgi:hypothetical protein
VSTAEQELSGKAKEPFYWPVMKVANHFNVSDESIRRAIEARKNRSIALRRRSSGATTRSRPAGKGRLGIVSAIIEKAERNTAESIGSTVTYSNHPASNLFPMMSEKELKELADDIRKNGLLEPIVRYNRMILDGRN